MFKTLTRVTTAVVMSTAAAYPQDAFNDRWVNGAPPIIITPSIPIQLPPIQMAPQLTITPQINITPQITVLPPIVTVGPPTITSPQVPNTPAPAPQVPAPATPATPAPKTTPVPTPTPPISPKMLAPVPVPRPPPRVYARPRPQYYYNDDDYYPQTRLSVPADRVNRGNANCNGIACYP